jgi:hypothetical protein
MPANGLHTIQLGGPDVIRDASREVAAGEARAKLKSCQIFSVKYRVKLAIEAETASGEITHVTAQSGRSAGKLGCVVQIVNIGFSAS